MNKDFIENCKLLKSHFTKLTQAHTNTGQSKFNYEEASKTSSTTATIQRAEQLLFMEKFDLLDQIDIEDIKQNALLNYSDDICDKLQTKQKNHRLCQRNNQFKWNDDIYCTTLLPYSKDKVVIFSDKTIETDEEYDNEEKQVLEKFELLEKKSKIIARNETGNNEVKVNNISPEKLKKTADELAETQKIVHSNNIEENYKEIHEKIPQEQKKVDFAADIQETDPIVELKIVPQQKVNIESVLEIKKINPEENEVSVESAIVFNEPKKCKEKRLKRDSHSSKINNFLEQVEKFRKLKAEKSKSFVSLCEETAPKQSSKMIENKAASYAHRFKAQKDIIEMQKEKLHEQNKLIEALKLNKIQSEINESLENAQKAFKKISPVHKHKVKLIEIENQEQNAQHIEINATLKLTKAPKIIQHMAERAKEREEKKLLINERKRILEQERKRQTEVAIQKKWKEEQLEKQERIAQMKAQRDQIRKLELMRQKNKKKYLEMTEIAIAHYKTNLKQNVINTFKMIIYRIRIQMEISKRFYENNIVIKYYQIWKVKTKKMTDYYYFVANRFHKKCYTKQAMNIWKMHYFEAIKKKQVAIDRYEMSLLYNYFIAWQKFTRKNQVEFKLNSRKADFHYLRVLLYHCFHSWRSLPAILQIERIQNERKRKWRLRVAEILTDYDPLRPADE